jgi:hypothetical protein
MRPASFQEQGNITSMVVLSINWAIRSGKASFLWPVENYGVANISTIILNSALDLSSNLARFEVLQEKRLLLVDEFTMFIPP